MNLNVNQAKYGLREFYNGSVKSWPKKKKDIFMYSTYNKGPIPRYPFFLRYLVFEISCF